MTEIVTQGDIREPLRDFLRKRSERFVVLSDANVAHLARAATRGVPGRLATYAFNLGERNKTLATVEDVLQSLLRSGADRETLVVGAGGGVAADLFGFSASVFMRGVPYAHVATSLVAMVDAAIGGKTGVDLAGGKNLAGTFCEPAAVFAWIDALRTLPFRHVREGLAEIVKAAIIEGGDFFDTLEELAALPFAVWPWEAIVDAAQRVKIAIVNDDKQEHGIRELLNLGHTFGHGIEAASRYRVTHGAAVSIGLRAAGLLAMKTGRFSRTDHMRVIALLLLLQLPGTMRQSTRAVFSAMQSDKKKRAGRLRFVLPRAIGDVEYGVQIPDRSVRAVLDRLRRPPGDAEFR